MGRMGVGVRAEGEAGGLPPRHLFALATRRGADVQTGIPAVGPPATPPACCPSEAVVSEPG